MHTYKIYLFEPVSMMGYTIVAVTGSKYSHAAIEIDGVLYDSSEAKGEFNVSENDPETRNHIFYEIKSEIDLSGWLEKNLGRQYDWTGVLGWLMKADEKDKFYCFEAVYSAMYEMGLVESDYKPAVYADCIIEVLEKYGK